MKLPGKLMLSLLLAITISACGADHPSGITETPEAQQTPAVLSGLKLPRPSSLPRVTSAPPLDYQRFVDGGKFVFGLPMNKASQDNLGSDGVLSPTYTLPASGGIGNAAFACLAFNKVAEYDGPAQIIHSWLVPPSDWSNAYMAVANYSSDRWDWYSMDEGPVALPTWSNYLAPSGQVVCLVLLLGTETCKLDWLIAGGSVLDSSYLSTDLNSDPTLNLAPLSVSFRLNGSIFGATVPAGYDWDFDGDGSMDLAGADKEPPAFLYETPGLYTCRVSALGSDGRAINAETTFTVVDPLNQPPVAAISADVSSGDAPLAVTLDASASTDDDTIVRYQWDVDGDGEYEVDTADVPALDYTFARNGNTMVTVQVTDNDFATSTASLQIHLDSGWRTAVIDNSTGVYQLRMAVTGTGINSRAVVAYSGGTNYDMFFSRAGSDLGTGWSSPVEPVNNALNDNLQQLDLMVNPVSGKPQIAFTILGGDSDRLLYFVSASTPDGSSWDPQVQVSPDPDFGYALSVAPGNAGHPGIMAVYGTTSGEQSLRYYPASNNDGTAWDAAVGLGNQGFTEIIDNVDIISTGTFPLAAVSGRLDGGDARFGLLAAGTSNGLTWDPIDLISGIENYQPSLTMVSGRPAFAAGGADQFGTLSFLRSGDPEGRGWSVTPQLLASEGLGGVGELAVVGGKPAIAYSGYGSDGLMFVSAADPEGSSWDAPYCIDSVNSSATDHIAMVSTNGFPVIGYYDYAGNRLLAAVWY